MNLKTEVQEALAKAGVSARLRYFKKSPYQARRYKPEFVGQEVWVYRGNAPSGFVITEEDWANVENREVIIKSI
jgi:hypothetical protein